MWFYYFSKEGFSGYKFAKTKNFGPFIEKAGGELSIKWRKSKHLKSNSCFCGFSEILLELDF
jgi:hypothetical protein